jgi:enoyl-CoA hydratase/carnithine racemase
MTYEHVDPGLSPPTVLRSQSGAVGEVVLNRPAALNAVTTVLARAFVEAVDGLVADGARALVVRGAGGTFCAGGDVDELVALCDHDPAGPAALLDAFAAMCAAVTHAPVPVIAAVDGYAMAGGFELAQSCDIVIVATDAQLADNHARYGLVPAGGGTQRLPRLVGRQRALALILTGDRLDGEQAVDWGLAYRAVPSGEVVDAARGIAARLAGLDAAALAAIKRLVRDGLALPLDEALARERATVIDHLARPAALAHLAAVTAREA